MAPAKVNPNLLENKALLLAEATRFVSYDSAGKNKAVSWVAEDGASLVLYQLESGGFRLDQLDSQGKRVLSQRGSPLAEQALQKVFSTDIPSKLREELFERRTVHYDAQMNGKIIKVTFDKYLYEIRAQNWEFSCWQVTIRDINGDELFVNEIKEIDDLEFLKRLNSSDISEWLKRGLKSDSRIVGSEQGKTLVYDADLQGRFVVRCVSSEVIPWRIETLGKEHQVISVLPICLPEDQTFLKTLLS